MRLLSHLFGIVLTAAVFLAHAAAPQQKGQAPGWYRMMLGDFEITALSDGTFEMKPEELLTGITPARVKAALDKERLASPVEASVNGFLVNTGSKLVLIDAGAAGLFGPTLGRLLANLKAAGYTPEQVDEIYITHMHTDHVGGLATPDGKAVFPNAIVRADAKESGYWLSPATLEQAPAAMKDDVKGAQNSLEPYVKAGRFKPFEGSVELVPGIRSLPAHGHTPGHSTYVAQSKGRKMVFWGDLMHVAAVQFPDPAVTIQFDSDSRAAMPQRRKAFADAAKGGYYVAVAHVSFPGIGQLRADGQGYRWLPVNYTTNAGK
jgi:glyoxylase-like metal-dependent hydrolase (beta-lactamase superfamily II)